MDIVIHAAVAENGIIGTDGGLPWQLSSDLKRFKAGTMGRPIIMGRKTFEGIGKPLPGRVNIVVTRDRGWSHEGVEAAGSLQDAITLATVRGRCMAGVEEIAVIGGGEIYAQAMPIADRLCITHVLAEPTGDTTFPAIDPALWRATECEDVPAGERGTQPPRNCAYERK